MDVSPGSEIESALAMTLMCSIGSLKHINTLLTSPYRFPENPTDDARQLAELMGYVEVARALDAYMRKV